MNNKLEVWQDPACISRRCKYTTMCDACIYGYVTCELETTQESVYRQLTAR
jgi:hypothetical protein